MNASFPDPITQVSIYTPSGILDSRLYGALKVKNTLHLARKRKPTCNLENSCCIDETCPVHWNSFEELHTWEGRTGSRLGFSLSSKCTHLKGEKAFIVLHPEQPFRRNPTSFKMVFGNQGFSGPIRLYLTSTHLVSEHFPFYFWQQSKANWSSVSLQWSCCEGSCSNHIIPMEYLLEHWKLPRTETESDHWVMWVSTSNSSQHPTCIPIFQITFPWEFFIYVTGGVWGSTWTFRKPVPSHWTMTLPRVLDLIQGPAIFRMGHKIQACACVLFPLCFFTCQDWLLHCYCLKDDFTESVILSVALGGILSYLKVQDKSVRSTNSSDPILVNLWSLSPSSLGLLWRNSGHSALLSEILHKTLTNHEGALWYQSWQPLWSSHLCLYIVYQNENWLLSGFGWIHRLCSRWNGNTQYPLLSRILQSSKTIPNLS